jgi:hypothetical protein
MAKEMTVSEVQREKEMTVWESGHQVPLTVGLHLNQEFLPPLPAELCRGCTTFVSFSLCPSLTVISSASVPLHNCYILLHLLALMSVAPITVISLLLLYSH